LAQRDRRPSAASIVVAAGLVFSLSAGVACGGGDGEGDARATSSAPATDDGDPAADTSWVARARGPEIEVYADAGADRPDRTLPNPNENGAPLVLLVDGREPDGDWVPVHLPVRPNGSKGWVRASDVALAHHDYRMIIELGAHRLTVTQGGRPVVEAPIGVGTADTPTPGGVYYVKELLRPPDPGGDYGPYAYGLSGFSNELTSFNGGSGVIGVHGTNDPASVGRDVSHGCIRVTNDVITDLVEEHGLPLGTPVEIVD
jgi:lipoprotein-anchoring transpeptidase ErfK/SrfK